MYLKTSIYGGNEHLSGRGGRARKGDNDWAGRTPLSPATSAGCKALALLPQPRCGPGPLPTLCPRPASPFPILSASSPFHVRGEPGLCAPGALSEFPHPSRVPGPPGRRGAPQHAETAPPGGINKPPAPPAREEMKARGFSSDHETGSERVRGWSHYLVHTRKWF